MSGDGLAAMAIRNRPVLLRFLAARGAGEEADDLFQDLWMKAQNVSSGPIAEPLAYLYRMADNLMLDRRRAARRRIRRDDQWNAVAGSDAGGASDQPSAERILLSRERLRAVDAKLASLGERTAAIFRRYRIDGVRQQDIAPEFGISLSSVEKHLQKAYNALADMRSSLDAESSDPRRPDIEGNHDVAG
jgi:RNA polymerase sigma-70 factor (ECF subfamily)